MAPAPPRRQPRRDPLPAPARQPPRRRAGPLGKAANRRRRGRRRPGGGIRADRWSFHIVVFCTTNWNHPLPARCAPGIRAQLGSAAAEELMPIERLGSRSLRRALLAVGTLSLLLTGAAGA